MGPLEKRRMTRIIVGAGLAVAAAIVALLFLRSDDDEAADSAGASALTSTAVELRELAEYLELAGTLDYAGSVTLTAQSSGVLIDLAPEGTVVRRGEHLYQIINEATVADMADVLAHLASARNSLVAARDQLSDALSGPSEADLVAARAAVADAREAQDSLVEPPSEAEITSAEAAVETASEALDTLLAPSAADRAEARSHLSEARSDLAVLRAGASQAEIDSARAAVLAAESDLAVLRAGASQAEIDSARAAVLAAESDLAVLRAGASQAEIDSARAAVLAAESDLAVLRAGASQAEIDLARVAVIDAEADLGGYSFYPDDDPTRISLEAELALVREALADLLGGASEAELDAAEAVVLSAREALADLLGGASEAELDAAEAAVQAAVQALDTLENPTAGDQLAARADLATAQEALADLLAGPGAAEIDLAEAAVLAAEEALADLSAGHSPADIEALEASVASAEAAVASAEADLAALAAGRSSRAVMYGSTPVYRTMTIGLEGDDVRQLEQNLADLGYGEAAGFSMDGVFEEATAEAVLRWQEATGQDPDGTVGPADIVFVAGPVRVGFWAQGVEVGQQVTTGALLAALTVIQTPVDGRMSTTQRVTASVPLSDRDLVSEGITVNVELPDSTDITGTVTAINPSPVLDDQTGENAVEVTILLAEPAPEVWIGATVDVEITETLIQDALVVPATALLALVEGGYAVEVLAEDGSVRLVGVETGLFVDGDVEVRSPELVAGVRVVVPR